MAAECERCGIVGDGRPHSLEHCCTVLGVQVRLDGKVIDNLQDLLDKAEAERDAAQAALGELLAALTDQAEHGDQWGLIAADVRGWLHPMPLPHGQIMQWVDTRLTRALTAAQAVGRAGADDSASRGAEAAQRGATPQDEASGA